MPGGRLPGGSEGSLGMGGDKDRGEFAEVLQGGGEGGDEVIDFGLRMGRAKGDAERGFGLFLREAEGQEGGRGFDGAGGAGRTGADGDAAKVEGNDEGFAFNAIEAEVAGVGEAGIGAVAMDLGQGEEGVFETVSEAGGGFGLGGESLLEEGGGGTEGGDAGDVFRAGAAAIFVAAAKLEGMERDALADEEGADAFGGAHFVAAEGVEIDAELAQGDGEAAGDLDAVGVEEGAVFVGDGSEFGQGLEGAEFVVGVHDGDEGRIGAEGLPQVGGRDETLRIDGEEGDGMALGLEGLEGGQDGGVFDLAADEVAAGAGVGDAEEGEVIGFGATT